MPASRYPFFSIEELSCRCGECEWSFTDEGMDPYFMEEKIVPLRMKLGFPLYVTSARRCSEHDANVGSSRNKGNGPHTTGRAIDIRCATYAQFNQLVDQAFTLRSRHNQDLRLFAGIGLKLRGPFESRFVHLDDLPSTMEPARPNIWTY